MSKEYASMRDKLKSGIFINRNFAFLLAGQVISEIGDLVFDTALVLWISTTVARNQPWTPLAVSGMLMAASIPSLIIGPFAGVFVDRWDKRRIMIFMDGIRAILITLLLLMVVLVSNPIWMLGFIYVDVFLVTICTRFFNAARFGLINSVVEEAMLTQASGMGQVMTNLAAVIGPPLAPIILLTLGIETVLIVNALSFVISLVAIILVSLPKDCEIRVSKIRSNFFEEIREGLHIFFRQRILMVILIAVVLDALGTGAKNALDILYITKTLHADGFIYGIMGTIYGAGSILSAIICSIFVQRVGLIRTLWLALMLKGILIILYANQVSIYPVMILHFIISLPVVAFYTVLTPILLKNTPNQMSGRVFSVIDTCENIAVLISIGLSGFLASTILRDLHATLGPVIIGPINIIFTATGILALLAGIQVYLGLKNSRADG